MISPFHPTSTSVLGRQILAYLVSTPSTSIASPRSKGGSDEGGLAICFKWPASLFLGGLPRPPSHRRRRRRCRVSICRGGVSVSVCGVTDRLRRLGRPYHWGMATLERLGLARQGILSRGINSGRTIRSANGPKDDSSV